MDHLVELFDPGSDEADLPTVLPPEVTSFCCLVVQSVDRLELTMGQEIS